MNDASRPAAMAAALSKSSLEKDFFEAFNLDFFAKTTSPIVYVSKHTSSAGVTHTVKTKSKHEFLTFSDFADYNIHMTESSLYWSLEPA